ncbi:MAG: type IV secretion system DNA-binding domain-containing protein [bacterium]|nr:type IV secretion system DNA-binding domain-containing protein [bacterium]
MLATGTPLIVYLVAIALLLAVVWFVVWLVLHAREGKALKNALSLVTMQVTIPKEMEKSSEEAAAPPKDFKELLSVAEQMFASLHSVFENGLNPWIYGQDSLIFEIISNVGQIVFYVSCPEGHQKLVERQIHSFYPDAQIDMIDGPNIFNMEQGEVVGASLKLGKRFVYPIKTYKMLESDPLNAISNAFSKLGEGANAALQIVIQPANQRWQIHTATAAQAVSEGKPMHASLTPAGRVMYGAFDAVGSALSSAGSAQNQAEQKQNERDNKIHRITPQQEELMKLFNEKGAKVGFRTIVRVISAAPDKNMAWQNCDNILAAFSQYNLPQGNFFRIIKPRQSVLLTDYVLKYFGHCPKMLLNTEELASMFHFPNRNLETPNILWSHSKLLPPPVTLPKEGVVIGKSIYRGEEELVRMGIEDRRRHLFMIGKTGVGKTTFFENMILQDIQEGKGLCFIDPLGDAIESILKKIPKERSDDVILFDPGDVDYPMGLNLLEFKNTEERDFLVQECIEMFYKLFDPNRTGMVGPQFEHWFRNAALTVMSDSDGGTLIEIPRLFTDDNFRKQKIAKVTDPIVRAFWDEQLAKTSDFHKSEMYNYFISKFGRFMTNDLMRNIIGQKKSAFNMREIMDSGKILLINLAKGKIGEINSNLLGMVMVSKIQIAAFSRADIPEETRKDFFLYVDEFQNFTTDTFATILSEARKYHLSLNITNQYIAQLTEKIRDAVIGNAGTIVIYRIGAADAEFLQKELPNVTINDMVNLDRFQVYVKLLINLTPSKPFSMKGIKSEVVENERVGEVIRQLVRFKYAKERTEVERVVLGKSSLAVSFPEEPGISKPTL